MSEVITFINMKGGVGKTTLAVNVAYTLSKIEGKKVLLIDMDPQMNATQYTLTESQMNEILEDRNKSVYGCLSPDYQANSVLDGYEQRKEEKWIFNVENTFDKYIDEFKFVKKDVNFLTKQVDILSSIVNTLLIIFYFQEYIKFDENTEKSLIRSAISNDLGYKKKVVEVLEEI